MKQKRTHTQNYDIQQKKLAEFYKKQSIAMCNFNYETNIDGRNLQKNVHLQSFMPVLQYQSMTV